MPSKHPPKIGFNTLKESAFNDTLILYRGAWKQDRMITLKTCKKKLKINECKVNDLRLEQNVVSHVIMKVDTYA